VGLLIGRLFGDATDDFRFDVRQVRVSLGQTKVSALLARLSLALLPLLAIGYGVLLDVDGLLNEADWSAGQMAQYLNAYVAEDALVETWEWELPFLSERRFHLPPFEAVDGLTRREQLGVAPEGKAYSLEGVRPDYLVSGPWSTWTYVYDEYIEQHCVLETSMGLYDLYACRS
jgi:hypothetical protein